MSAVALLGIVGATGAAFAQNSENMETVVVTGFRESLEKALDLKRASVEASDSILAEDIAKFPDMNVSESLQRIPGVAITRESGEGREIMVRGLGAQFTRVRINGIEAMATVGSQDVSTSGGGTNRGRAFDFNVFASDLFNKLTIHKSASASLEEGSLGATVDLSTGHPFDFNGFLFTVSAQGSYQSLSGGVTPRVAALVTNTYANGKLGILLSAAFSATNTMEAGTSSVRWNNNTNTSSTGAITTGYNFASVNSLTSGTDFTDANAAFKPRFPRYDIVPTHTKRLGMTASVQWQPNESTLFTVDALYADFAQVRNEYYIEAPSFSTSGSVISASSGSYVDTGTSATMYYKVVGANYQKLINYDASDYAAATGVSSYGTATTTLNRAEVVGVGLRNEHRIDHLDTRFMQVTIDGTHSFSDAFKVHVLAGWTESHHRNPIQTTVMADYGCFGSTNTTVGCGAGTSSDPFIYDYSNGDMPYLNFGNVDVTSTSGWFLSNVRERQEYAYNSYRSVQGDFEYKVNDALKLSGGFDVRNYGYGTLELRRGVSTSTSEATSFTAAQRSVALSSFTTSISLPISAPSGSDTTWFTFDMDKASTALGLWDGTSFPMSTTPGYSNTGTVRENDYGGWLQADWDTTLYGMAFRGNIGARYILTESKSVGYALVNSVVTAVEGHHIYHDWLPSLNAVLEPFDNFLIRFNANYAMSRPNMTSMLPTGSITVSGSNATATVGNPALNPVRSKNLDLAFEWYYGKGSLISVAGFWKHIDTFIQTLQSSDTAANNPFGLEESAFVAACGGTGTNWSTVTATACSSGAATLWTYSTSVNAKGAPLYGTEINWQQQLSFLPHPFDNFGLLGNFTYVQAQQSYYNSNGTLIMKADLTNLSRISYNGTVYYDDGVLQARVVAAFRSHYLINSNISSNNNNYGIWSKSTLNVDASATYKYSESIMLTFDALNITDQASNIVADYYAQRSYQYHKTGPVYFVGIRYTY